MQRLSLNQPQPFQAGVAVLADDDVVVHLDPQRLGHVNDLARHVDVGARRGRVAGRVVVNHANEISNLLILQYYSGSLEMMVPRIGIGCSCPTVIITPDHPCVRQVVWMHGTALYSFRPTHQARQLDRAPPCQL